MDMSYVVKGKYKGEEWKSEFFDDAQDMSDKYSECLDDPNYTELKQYNVCIHYEEIVYDY